MAINRKQLSDQLEPIGDGLRSDTGQRQNGVTEHHCETRKSMNIRSILRNDSSVSSQTTKFYESFVFLFPKK